MGNAKASVRMAVKDAQKRKLKNVRGQMALAEKKLGEEEQRKAKAKIAALKKMSDAKIRSQRFKFKKMVDAAVQLAPRGEAKIRMKAKLAFKKAKIAAQAYAAQMRRSMRPRAVNGKRISKKQAADCVKNPAGCKMFTLSNHNIAAAAKFAESRARKAKRAQLRAKEGVAKAMAKLTETTKVAQKYAQKASDLDEKETRIKLAKLQLTEARAAAAFHSAATARLQSKLANHQMQKHRASVDDKMAQFKQAMQEMKVTSSADLQQRAKNAKLSKKKAFKKAQEAARALLKLPGA